MSDVVAQVGQPIQYLLHGVIPPDLTLRNRREASFTDLRQKRFSHYRPCGVVRAEEQHVECGRHHVWLGLSLLDRGQARIRKNAA